ncbi:CapA family protein [Microbacterium nymphoidis]|uniref:CapA family protein n=1 Tax=Microbacterium nymphoidis TaxID=2898586 RepID=UPI001E5A3EFF|nr:CapA family protein [Microbacterium nymphoidis]MCD2497586.1 CapA family protein [Microbacterium nymphoidis]
MTPADHERLAWADALKGALILLVVFWHVVLKTYLQVDWRIGLPIPGMWGLLSDIIWPFLMPLFLLVSGVFAADALSRPGASVLRSRVLRFLYLYLLWTLIHMAAMWAFPDFPTAVPRSVAEFVEAITISPPNTWYLYALALYFLLARALRRLPTWAVLVPAAALTVLVASGVIDIVSNRGSMLSNLLFFLIGARFAPAIKRFATRPRPALVLLLTAGYAALYGGMRVLDAATVPGVWPLVSLAGVAMGLSLAPLLPAIPLLGAWLTRLGRHTLPVYLLHMPILVLVDAVVIGWVSDGRGAVQLVAAVVLPIMLTALVTAGSALLGAWIEKDGPRWLLELPTRMTSPRVPWRVAGATVMLIIIGVVAARASALPAAPEAMPQVAPQRAGEVSIGAVGDVLVYDTGHRTPEDRGRGHFDAVRSWFTEDLVTGNLEQAITADTGYDKCGGQDECLAFRSDPDVAPFLAGFDLLNLANNHSRDYGDAGFTNTRDLLADAGIRTVGERDEVAWTRVGDSVVAVVGFAPYDGFNRVTDLRHVRAVVRSAAAEADIVIVHAHMGAEGPGADVVHAGTETMFGENRGDPMAFAHAAVDAGADVVIGHGPHVLRGMEQYRGRIIAYSLGNFGGGGVFGAEEETRRGAYLSLRLRPDGALIEGTVHSLRFAPEDGAPLPDPSGSAASAMDERGRRDFGDHAIRVGSGGTLVMP